MITQQQIQAVFAEFNNPFIRIRYNTKNLRKYSRVQYAIYSEKYDFYIYDTIGKCNYPVAYNHIETIFYHNDELYIVCIRSVIYVIHASLPIVKTSFPSTYFYIFYDSPHISYVGDLEIKCYNNPRQYYEIAENYKQVFYKKEMKMYFENDEIKITLGSEYFPYTEITGVCYKERTLIFEYMSSVLLYLPLVPGESAVLQTISGKNGFGYVCLHNCISIMSEEITCKLQNYLYTVVNKEYGGQEFVICRFRETINRKQDIEQTIYLIKNILNTCGQNPGIEWGSHSFRLKENEIEYNDVTGVSENQSDLYFEIRFESLFKITEIPISRKIKIFANA